MTTLKVIGDGYLIDSEKVDECYPSWGAWSFFFGFVIGILWMFLICRPMLIFQGKGTCESFALQVIPPIAAIILIFIPSAFIKCGLKIKLKKVNCIGHSSLIDEISYQFTGNTEQDAINIQSIVNLFEERVNKLIEDDRLKSIEENRKRKLCCDQYKSVIDLVKK